MLLIYGPPYYEHMHPLLARDGFFVIGSDGDGRRSILHCLALVRSSLAKVLHHLEVAM